MTKKMNKMKADQAGVSVLTFNHSWKKGRGMGQGRSVVEFLVAV